MNMDEKFYLYRFLDAADNVIYIGRTNSINRRFNEEHFTDCGNLPEQGYEEVQFIEYITLDTYSQLVAFEAILIATTKPKYNKEFNDNGAFDFKLPEMHWVKYDWDIDLFRNRNSLLHKSINSILSPKEKLRSGFIELDRRIALIKGSLTLIGGISPSYKTSFALNVCNHLLKQDHKVLYVNLKNSSEELLLRLLTINSLIDKGKLYNEELTEQDWLRLAPAANQLAKSKLYFSKWSVNQRSIYDIIMDFSDNFSLIVVDDIYSISSDNTYGKDKTHNIMRILKSVAVDMHVPIIALSPISRGKTQSRTDHRPMLKDLEYDSMISYPDNILLLYNNCEPDEPQDILEVIVAKNYLEDTGTTLLGIHEDIVVNIESFENQ